jgi:hypothetical protein
MASQNIKLKVLEKQNDQPILVSFPTGVPPSSEGMVVTSVSKGSGKKRKTIIDGQLNDISYHGCDFGSNHSLSNDLCQFAVGILDEKTNEMTIIPANHAYVMSSSIGQLEEDDGKVSQMTYNERRQSLTDAFGSKKKKRAMKAAESNTISSENISGALAIENAIHTLAEPLCDNEDVTFDAAQQAIENIRKELLPEYDTLSTDIAEAYPMRGIIPHPVLMSLREYYDMICAEWNIQVEKNKLVDSELYREKWEDKLKKENTTDNIMEILKYTINRYFSDYKLLSKQICYLLMWHYILLTCTSVIDKRKPVLKEDLVLQLHNPPSHVIRHITETYLVFQKSNGKNAFTISKTLMYVSYMYELLCCYN